MPLYIFRIKFIAFIIAVVLTCACYDFSLRRPDGGRDGDSDKGDAGSIRNDSGTGSVDAGQTDSGITANAGINAGGGGGIGGVSAVAGGSTSQEGGAIPEGGAVECITSAQCRSDTAARCDPISGVCIACQGRADCLHLPLKQVCSRGVCVECAEHADCMSGACDVITHTCVPCVLEDAYSVGCSGASPVCKVGSVASNNLCVECTATSSKLCTGAKPICGTDNLCRACKEHGECAFGVCDGQTGRCLGDSEIIYVNNAASSQCSNNGGGARDAPFCTLQTDAARRLDKSRLYESEPRLSVWPSTRMRSMCFAC
jgi:hypothetical protein